MPFFTVSIPTRNRPEDFVAALDSVLSQSFTDLDVIVVDDGSTGDARDALEALKEDLDPRVRWIHLPHRARGYGHPFARNEAATLSESDYLCTLDDDDIWTDTEYLKRTHETITGADRTVDLHISNQAAYFNDELQQGPIWLEALADTLRAENRAADATGAFTVSVRDLLRNGKFCHLNNLIVRRELYLELGGMDESLRYEPDRDLYLRIVDGSDTIIYSPHIVSKHHIPDPAKKVNVSTQSSNLQKRLYQIYSLNKVCMSARQREIRRYARQLLGYTLKDVAVTLAAADRIEDALAYALAGLGTQPTLKWTGYTAWLSLKAIGAKLSDH